MLNQILMIIGILMGGLAYIAIAYAGFIWITAAGDPGATARAKTSMHQGFIALILAAIAFIASQTPLTRISLTGISLTGFWTPLTMAAIPCLAAAILTLTRKKPRLHPAAWTALTTAALISWSLMARSNPDTAPVIMTTATILILAHTGLLIAGKVRGRGPLSSQKMEAAAVMAGINTGAITAMTAASI